MSKSNLPIKCPACSVLNPPDATTCMKCERPFFTDDRAAVVAVSPSAAAEALVAASTAVPPPPLKVRVVDIDMPIGSMVLFLLKWAIAAVPAALIIALVSAFIIAIIGQGVVR